MNLSPHVVTFSAYRMRGGRVQKRNAKGPDRNAGGVHTQ